MGEGMSCQTCAKWDLADASPSMGGNYEGYRPEAGDDKRFDRWNRAPHANQNWSRCDAAAEGFAEEFDAADMKMAVWDGSQYLARLLTRCDHVCGEWTARP